ncbi:glycosyltransferase family 2 protein [Hwanghaeella grinnelliae]|uniref:Glycosyltransferase family 2 protein n=1 Tax=Hwanghaeella grinnelliae TaxID=2500179 RepID=A0A3S2W2G7_9PROT|nr:glycosyltransferase family 2 protein [Hwanghaeella grinnelliae]RVU34114.1 glycosyltransferase family 2 protein [Hwanghaeella grinnelliae]
MQPESGVTVAVIIPTYNRAHCVGDAIDSVLNQDPPADEVIIVDDGSTDDTATVLAAYGDRIKVLRQKNAGVAAARNAGIKLADSSWAAFLDSDDLWLPGRMASLHRDLAVAGQNTVAHTGDMRLTGDGYSKRLFELRNLSFDEASGTQIPDAVGLILPGIFPSVTAVRIEETLALGGFSEDMPVHEDTSLFSKLAIKGAWVFTGDVLAQVRRLAGDQDALINLYDENRLKALSYIEQSLMELLAMDLTPSQRDVIGKSFSGVLFEKSYLERLSGSKNWIKSLFASLKYHPNRLTSSIKVLAALVLGTYGYRLVFKQRDKFKRSG